MLQAIPNEITIQWARNTSATLLGVESIAAYIWFHLIRVITGHVDSLAAHCITEAMTMPGTTNCRYGMPPTPPEVASTSCPTPRPIAAKKKIGVTNRENTVLCQVRRHTVVK